jgi:hypothetical protein
MRRFRLALVLPVIQFVIAAILLQWGYRTPVPRGSELYVPTVRLICRGLNAPALLFRFLNPISRGPEFDWIPRSVIGFDTDDIFFLFGVIIVWYIAGRALDQRGTSTTAERSGIAVVLVPGILLLALGVLLSLVGLHDLGPSRPNNPGPPIGAVLTLMWSVTLICLSGRRLVQAIRPVPRTSS